MADETIGNRLAALRKRAGMTLDDVASALGLKGRSSVQRFFLPHKDSLSIDDAAALVKAFEGKGKPPILRDEIFSMCDPIAAQSFAGVQEIETHNIPSPRYRDLPADVPVYGTVMGTYRERFEGQDVEQAFIDYSARDFFPRLPTYASREGIYGVYVIGTSMEPRWDEGDPAYVDPKRGAAIGDDVVVYLVDADGADGEQMAAVLIKRLVKRSASFVELEQYNPRITFRIEMKHVKAIHRVIPRREHNGFR